MSYLFFLVVGLFWGILCGVCDARGILRNDRPIMQLVCGLLGYGITWLLFGLNQPEGGHWIPHLLLVVTVSQFLHYFTRARLTGRC